MAGLTGLSFSVASAAAWACAVLWCPETAPGPPGVPWPDRADQHPSRTVKPTAAPSQGTVSCVGTWGAQGKWMQGLAHAQLNSSHPP